MAGYLLLFATLASSPASTSRAEQLTQRAITEYDGGEFDDALADAKQAYALEPAAGLLYNLGQIHRALHRWEEAAFSYRAYLHRVPNAPNRSTVEGFIQDMDKRVRDQLADRHAPPGEAPQAVVVVGAAPPVATPKPTPKPHVERIAILDVRPHGVSDDMAQGVTALVVHDIRKQAAGASVVGADEIRAMIGVEHQKQLLGCNEVSCLAEIGGAMGAERLVLGSLSRFGDKYVLDLKLIESRSAKVLLEGSARVQQESDLPDAVAQSVDGLFPRAKTSVDDVWPELAQAPAKPRSSHALAWTLFAGSAVAAGFAIYGTVRVAQTQGALNQLTAAGSAANYQANLGPALQASNAQNWQTGAIVLGLVAVAAAVGGAFTW